MSGALATRKSRCLESLQFDEKDQKTVIRLKFKDKEVLQKGGYIVVDEVENHFNKEIVTTLMRFFMDSKLNTNGGTLIFSTHYPELLDEYDRNDSIFIIRNRNGITVENLSTILKRNDKLYTVAAFSMGKKVE